ncbi:MAG: hypothetical protein HYR63_14175 [Proteobacteria bacterium]|nr:hypothetical protein [Pseudomonadota bacterium]MBI3498802.1 hypothetical protein [Pseudomonadota bacterium]
MDVIDRSIKAALRLYNDGNPDAAEQVCRGILKVEPTNAEVLHLLAQFDCRLGRARRAAGIARQAIALEPARAKFLLTLGTAEQEMRNEKAAGDGYRRSIAVDIEHAEAHLNLGALQPIRSKSARACWRRAAVLRPDLPEVHNNLAGRALASAKVVEAERRFGRALSLRPSYPQAWNGLASAAGATGAMHRSLLAARRALALAPAFAEAMNNQGTILVAAGAVGPAVRWLSRAVATAPGYADAGSNLLFAFAYDDSIALAALFAAQLAWAKRHAPVLRPLETRHGNAPEPERRLRVGYVSADFREHPIAWNVEGLFEHHDRRSVELHLYSSTVSADRTTERLRRLAEHWHDATDLGAADIAEAVRRDGIDVLVSLAPHTASNRPLFMAYRPAPVQVAFHGIGSTGLEAVSYWITDPVLHPEDSREAFTEELVRLPCFYLHRPPEDAPEPSGVPSLALGAITFGSCNNPAKLSPAAVRLWAEVLRALPASRLLVKYVDRFRDPLAARRLLEAFAAYGIGEERIVRSGGLLDRRGQLELLSSVDIALDPVPFNGSTTSFEALWMGVPLVTLLGDRFVGRVGASLLQQVGLADLIARTPADYVAIAARLAGDGQRLKALRASLRQRVAASPLCDAPAHARSIDAAYRMMWRRWCRRP